MSRVRNLVDYQSQTADLDGDATRDLNISGTVTAGAVASANVPDVNLTIAPEVLEIQVDAPDAGQDIMWKWTWEQSTLPYARRTITNSAELNVPLYKEGTYVVNNFAAYDIHGSMTQTHSLYLKWIKSAGTDNLVSWATSTGPISDTHPDINGGVATDVQRITVNVPTTITPPSLTNPSVSYTVTNTASGSYTFSGSASGNNPNLGPFYRGGTYTINITASGHPFYFTTDNGTNFSAGTYFGEYTTGVTGSRNDTGSVTFTVPAVAPDTLYYQCGNHSAMRGEITIKDLAVETNINGNYVVYFQHTQEGHATPVELRPIPSLVNQMCLVYDNTSGKFVPQDLATYVENTPSFENKIREVAGTAELVVEDGSAVIAKVNVYDDSTYLPLTGNNPGDQAFATDTDILYIWDGLAWQQAGAANSDDLTEGSTNLFYTDARVSTYLSSNGYDTATNIVATITDSAPATLDTLNELAAALGDDPNFATTVSTNIGTKVSKSGDTMSGTLNIESGGQLRLKGTSYTYPADNVGVLNYDTVSGNFDIDARSNGGSTNIRFSTSNAGSASTKMFIKNDGNIGIGTTNPATRLHVARSTSDNGQRTIYADGNHNAITTNGTNYLHNVWIENHNFDINSGVTDSGYRIGLNIEGYHDSTVFEGTLATQKNIWSRNGTYPGSGTGTITNSYNLHLETLSGGGITITNNYGLYQTGAGTKNYFEGEVGIGVASPQAKLHVYNENGGNATDKATMLSEAVLKLQPHTTNSTNLLVAQVNGGNGIGLQVTNFAATANWDIALSPFGGNVGIGATSPSAKLHVQSTATSEPLALFQTVTGGDASIRVEGVGGEAYIELANTSVSTGSSSLSWGIGLNDNQNLYFGYGPNSTLNKTNGSTGTQSAFLIDTTGNIGINHNSPSEKLHVDGSIIASGNIGVTQSDGDYLAKLYQSSADGFLELYTGEATPVSRVKLSAYGDSYISPNGSAGIAFGSGGVQPGNGNTNTGIGFRAVNTATSVMLSVSRTDGNTSRFNRNGIAGANINMAHDGSTVGSIDTSTSGTTYNTTSDRRLKDNITTITDGKEKLLAMKPVTHTWIDNPDEPQVHGFIAQEMQEVIPEAVSGDAESDEMMSMDYGRITPVIVAALQDALNEIKELKTRIDELENK